MCGLCAPRSDRTPRQQRSSPASPPAAADKGVKRPVADEGRTPVSAAGGLTIGQLDSRRRELDASRPAAAASAGMGSGGGR